MAFEFNTRRDYEMRVSTIVRVSHFAFRISKFAFPYSHLNATIGSTLVARRAGM